MTVILILLYVSIFAIVMLAPALLGALLRIFLRETPPTAVGLLAGALLTLLYSARSGDHGAAFFVRSFQEAHIPERLANVQVTAIIVFQIVFMAAIASLGIRFIDRRRKSHP